MLQSEELQGPVIQCALNVVVWLLAVVKDKLLGYLSIWIPCYFSPLLYYCEVSIVAVMQLYLFDI